MEHMAEEYSERLVCQDILYPDDSKNSNIKYSEEQISENIFKNLNKFKHEEYQYLNLLENILENGLWFLSKGRKNPYFNH